MKKKLNNDGGFTLVELVIAMAVLAFLMLAVSSLMGSGVLSYRKTKAEISIQTSAQETYNTLTDAIMQATDITIVGFTSSDDIDFTTNAGSSAANVSYYYFVKDEVAKQKLVDSGISEGSIKLFSELSSNDKVYVHKMIIDNSEDIDMSMVSGESMGTKTIDGINYVTYTIGTDEIINLETDLSKPAVYDTDDTVTKTFTFSEENMYYEMSYKYMTELSDVVSNWSDVSEANKCLYNDQYRYVELNNVVPGAPSTISCCIARIDSDSNSIALDLDFEDNNMTYTTLGMVNVRNSYVLKAKQ